ncbi:MAG TPA: LuxR C-terminal-related transcriptional regulator [Anaerolineaceae bacterium]|nr:LuxR C-terminal-related transcriptional regulator [Anaerolineaceae bacterium]
MTRVLYLPGGQALLIFDSPLTVEQIIGAVYNDTWLPPPPYDDAVTQARRQAVGRAALRAMSAGEAVVVTPVHPLRDTPPTPEGEPPRLTDRQVEVLQLMVEGLSTKQIAEALRLSRRAVYNHVAGLKAHFHTASRAELISRSVAQGYCTPVNRKQ